MLHFLWKRLESTFAFVGAKKFGYPHHHPKFDIDEEALSVGTQLYVDVATNFLK